MFFRLAALALALVLTSVCSLAQRSTLNQQQMASTGQSGEPTPLSGNVRSADNKPLKDVRVELREAGSGVAVGSVYTNASGNFEFPRVTRGMYELVATAGLEETRERVEINGPPGIVNLRLAVRTAPSDASDHNSISVAQYKVPGKAREEFRKANKLAGEQKAEEAKKHLENALTIYPAYADAFTLRGILKLDAHDHQGAIADLQKAIEADGNYALAYIVMGAAQNLDSKFDDAIRSLERGQTLAPTSWQAYFEMGKALVGKAKYEPALAQLDRAQALAPTDYPLIHLVKAHAMLATNNYSDAMTELQAYLAKEPQGPNSEQAHKMLDRARAFAAKK
jgi:Carboxypeptidase regulatory-like domain/Tetratricopeptide repeat